MKETTHHVLVWGWLRLFLAMVQITCAPLGMIALLGLGVGHWLTWTFLTAATTATVTSLLLYRARPDPRLSDRERGSGSK